jgi:hypothetical protein
LLRRRANSARVIRMGFSPMGLSRYTQSAVAQDGQIQ